ncbi:hypothetical protein [Streptomyces sp. NPDC059743]|uniref:hypothetical protein n=1 Tax=Streptomyces sp. NPDC059743 TaxID=3346928 RepID=UPI00365FC102
MSAPARTADAERGFDDTIQLDQVTGRVAAATITNVSLVRQGCWPRPGLPVTEADLHQAQEVFLTGTASELVPAREIDSHHLEPRGCSAD